MDLLKLAAELRDLSTALAKRGIHGDPELLDYAAKKLEEFHGDSWTFDQMCQQYGGLSDRLRGAEEAVKRITRDRDWWAATAADYKRDLAETMRHGPDGISFELVPHDALSRLGDMYHDAKAVGNHSLATGMKIAGLEVLGVEICNECDTEDKREKWAILRQCCPKCHDKRWGEVEDD